MICWPSSACIRQSLALALNHHPSSLSQHLSKSNIRSRVKVYIFVRLLLVVLIAVEVLFILIVLILKLVLVKVIIKALLELQCLSSEPVDGAWNELLLDVFAELVIELKLGLDVVVDLFVLIVRRRGRVEEVEE